MPYRVPHRRSDLPPNHDGSPGRRRLWFPPAAAALGKIVSASTTRFPDDSARTSSMAAAVGGATTVGALVALPTWPLAAACAAAAGFMLGCGALVTRPARSHTTWVGTRGLAVVERRPLEPAAPTVVLFRDVIAVDRQRVAHGLSDQVEDVWVGAARTLLVIASRVEAVRPALADPDIDLLPTDHPLHFARAARRAWETWRARPPYTLDEW